MIIDFIQFQKQRFMSLVNQIVAEPQKYLDFDSVSDFYKAVWLDDFPKSTIWTVSGLDDGAEDFEILIEYQDLYLTISIHAVDDRAIVKFGVKL